jgi:type I restriction enzyme S subunit
MPDRTPVKALADLATLRTEKIVGAKDAGMPYVGLEHMASGEPFLLGTALANSSISTNSVFCRGDILFGKLRPNLRKSLAARFDGYCSTDILVLQPNTGFDSGFVSRVFQREEVFDEAVRTAEGTKMPRTSWARLRQYEVFVPDADAERAAIAGILDAADEAIERTEALIGKLKAIKAGLLYDLLTRGLNDNGELRDPERHPEDFIDTPVGCIPRVWKTVPLGQCLQEPPQNGIYKPPRKIGRGTLLVGQTCITRDRVIDWGLSRRAEVSDGEIQRFGLITDDILISRVFATVDGVGLPALVPRTLEPAVYESNMLRLRWNPEVVLPRLAFLFLLGSRARRHVRATVNSSTQNSINQAALMRMPVIRPPREEQRTIVATLAAHQEWIHSEEVLAAKLKALKKGLMQDLLSGRVHVGGQEATI